MWPTTRMPTMMDEPMIIDPMTYEIPVRPNDPDAHGFNDYEFGFEAEYGVPVGFNLEQSNETAKDPLADIKRRRRDLQHERVAKEAELQHEYESRLQDFELDFQQKERELEKEKLY